MPLKLIKEVVALWLCLVCVVIISGSTTLQAQDEPLNGERASASIGNTSSSQLSTSSDVINFSIEQWQPNTFIDIKVPKPSGLVLAEHISGISPKMTFASNAKNWKLLKKHKIDQFSSDGLLLISIARDSLSSLDEAQTVIKQSFGEQVVFFGNIPDTYLAYNPFSSFNEEILIYGYTKIDTLYLFVTLYSILPGQTEKDLERYKQMASDYILELRKLNPGPLKAYEVEQIEKCKFPGGETVDARGQTVFAFQDCVGLSNKQKKLPLPMGLLQVDNSANNFKKFTFASDLEKYKAFKNNGKTSDNLSIINVSKFYYENEQEIRDYLYQMPWFKEIFTIDDLPHTYLAFDSTPQPTCIINMAGTTKVDDEFLSIFLRIQHDCSVDDDIVKQSFIDYIRQVRQVNGL